MHLSVAAAIGWLGLEAVSALPLVRFSSPLGAGRGRWAWRRPAGAGGARGHACPAARRGRYRTKAERADRQRRESSRARVAPACRPGPPSSHPIPPRCPRRGTQRAGRLHDLRHLHATTLLLSGVSPAFPSTWSRLAWVTRTRSPNRSTPEASRPRILLLRV